MVNVVRSSRAAFLASALLLCLSLPLTTRAQLSADRPGFGTGTTTVEVGAVQVGLGYALRGNGSTSHEIGQGVLRYGLTDGIELRGGVNSYVLTGAPVDNGYSGTTVGVKLRLYENDVASVSGLASLGLPTETGGLSTPDDRARQDLVLAFDGAVGEAVTVSINGGTSFYYASGVQNDREWEALFIPTVSLGHAESVGAYAGYAGFYNDGPSRHWVEGGITYLTTPDTQLDVNTGYRVDGDADPFFIGIGVAHRF